ncbi:ATP-binding protein [Streptomyces sp. NPDC051976]|uniref:ATP-binding protein n=1 Tax=Streptomyces sp. NPDC051976 TaxID=3154947 RepID=UPI00341367B2
MDHTPHAVPHPEAHRYLPHNATAPAAARRLTRALLTAWGWSPDGIDRAVLVVSELVTNGVEHARPPLSLQLRPIGPDSDEPDLGIRVTDGGPADEPGPWTHSCAPDEHGRGSLLIACLSTPTETRRPARNQWLMVSSA